MHRLASSLWPIMTTCQLGCHQMANYFYKGNRFFANIPYRIYNLAQYMSWNSHAWCPRICPTNLPKFQNTQVLFAEEQGQEASINTLKDDSIWLM